MKTTTYVILSLVSTLFIGNAMAAGIPDNICVKQIDRVFSEFQKSLNAANPDTQVVVGYACKLNPCVGGTQKYIAKVTNVTGFDWHSSSIWAAKAASKYEFAIGSNVDSVLIDTTTGYHNVRCATQPDQTPKVYWTNWLQWVNHDAQNQNNCSTMGALTPPSIAYWVGEEGTGSATSWCKIIPVSGDLYCTYVNVNGVTDADVGSPCTINEFGS